MIIQQTIFDKLRKLLPDGLLKRNIRHTQIFPAVGIIKPDFYAYVFFDVLPRKPKLWRQ